MKEPISTDLNILYEEHCLQLLQIRAVAVGGVDRVSLDGPKCSQHPTLDRGLSRGRRAAALWIWAPPVVVHATRVRVDVHQILHGQVQVAGAVEVEGDALPVVTTLGATLLNSVLRSGELSAIGLRVLESFEGILQFEILH